MGFRQGQTYWYAREVGKIKERAGNTREVLAPMNGGAVLALAFLIGAACRPTTQLREKDGSPPLFELELSDAPKACPD